MRTHRCVLGLMAAALLGAAVSGAGRGPARRRAAALRRRDRTRAPSKCSTSSSIEQPSPRVHQFRALCLDRARRGLTAPSARWPTSSPPIRFFALEAEAASPRVAAQFAAVRRRLLPPLIRRGFADATALYREGATARARQRFDDVLRLLDDPALQSDQSLADLALVASAFVELTKAQAPPPPLAVISRPIVLATAPPVIAAPARPRAGAAGRPVIRRGRLCPRTHACDGQRAGGVRAGRGDGAAAAQVDAARRAGRLAQRSPASIALEVDARGRVIAAASRTHDSPGLRPGRARGRPPVGVPAGAAERPSGQVGDHGRDRAAAGADVGSGESGGSGRSGGGRLQAASKGPGLPDLAWPT